MDENARRMEDQENSNLDSTTPQSPPHEAQNAASFSGVGIQNFGKIFARDVNIGGRELDVFENLDYLPEALFNAKSKQNLPTCLENTRKDVLRQIQEWADGNNEKHIYWLKGMAGTGKSTIARTVARNYHELGRLGASFFFSRGGGDLSSVNKFATTIAAQLATFEPTLKNSIRKAMLSTRIPDLGLMDQWNKLVLKPLVTVKHRNTSALIVIDALDECDGEKEISLLIQCLVAATKVNSIQLRIFVTSRPDQPVNVGFGNSRDMRLDFILHDIEKSIIDEDLTLFYKDELTAIKSRYGLSDRFIANNVVQQLVSKSSGLFIYAATVCRFLEEGKQLAEMRLNNLITAKGEPNKLSKELDQIYTTVLTYSFSSQHGSNEAGLEPNEAAKLQALFTLVVGSIVVLFDVITSHNLATLINKPENDIVLMLHCLHSLLDVPNEGTKPIRLLHPSFRDFLLDPQRCQDKRFFVDAKETHRRLHICCRELMGKYLRKNMCNVERPGTRIQDVPKVDIDKFITFPVQYACRYWINHAKRSEIDLVADSEILSFWQSKFLFWLEALSWIGRLSEGIISIRLLEKELAQTISSYAQSRHSRTAKLKHLFSLQKWVAKLKSQKRHAPQSLALPPAESLDQFAYDTMRYLLDFGSILGDYPLQIYCSTLLFSPDESLLRKYYAEHIPQWIIRQNTPNVSWSPYLQRFSHSSSVLAVSFSPDGRLLASGSSDGTVRLWDVVTGTPQHVLEGHLGAVRAVAFSKDNQQVISASSDTTLRFWDVERGSQQRILEGIMRPNAHPVFTLSQDGQLCAFGTQNCHDITLLDLVTEAQKITLKGHSSNISALSFSPENKMLASSSYDGTVRVWDIETGTTREIEIPNDSDFITAMTFSPNGQHLAMCSGNNNIWVWDREKSVNKPILVDDSKWGRIEAIGFAPDSQMLVLGSNNHTLQVWDITTGAQNQILKGHSESVNAVAFSPDGRLLLSGSDDCTTRVWDMAMSTQQHASGSHSSSSNPIAFSSDGRLVALGSDKTVQIWSAATGVLQHMSTTCASPIHAVAFSPDSRLVALSSSKTIWIMDATTSTDILQPMMDCNSDLVTAIAFSPNNGLLASGSYGSIQIWDINTRTQKHLIRRNPPSDSAIAFSLDNELLAFGSLRDILVWDIATGTDQHTLKGHHNDITAVAFSPHSRLLVSSSLDRTIRLWDAVKGIQVQIVADDIGIRFLSFSSCGSYLITDRGSINVTKTQPHTSLYVSDNWVRENDENILFLHPDYRDQLLFVSGELLVFQHPLGNSVLQLSNSSKLMTE